MQGRNRPSKDGRSFLDQAAIAITMIDEAARALHRDADEIHVRASPSLAVRWLIPALGRLAESHPRLRVQVETATHRETPDRRWDVSIDYRRSGEAGTGRPLVSDLVLPLVSPLLPGLAGYRTLADLPAIPALRCASNDWDWTLWCDRLSIETDAVRIGHAFDTDDAAIRGAVAGLGMVLASPLLTRAELRDATLVPLPGFEPVELGHYDMRARDAERRAVRQFCRWLTEDAGRRDAPAEGEAKG